MDGLTWMRDMINGIEYESMSKKGAMRWCWLSFKIFQHFFEITMKCIYHDLWSVLAIPMKQFAFIIALRYENETPLMEEKLVLLQSKQLK